MDKRKNFIKFKFLPKTKDMSTGSYDLTWIQDKRMFMLS